MDMLDPTRVQDRWREIRDDLWKRPIDRAIFSHAHFVGLDQGPPPTLVVGLSMGALMMMTVSQKREAQRSVERMFGKGFSILFLDDKTPLAEVQV